MKIKKSYIGVAFILVFALIAALGIIRAECSGKSDKKCSDNVCRKVSK